MKEAVVEFEGRMSAEVRRQEKLDRIEERDFRRGNLPGKYTARILYEWNNGKFEEEYLRKLEDNGLYSFHFPFLFLYLFSYMEN